MFASPLFHSVIVRLNPLQISELLWHIQGFTSVSLWDRFGKHRKRFLSSETPIPTGVSGEGNNSPVSSRKSFHGGWKNPWKETEAKPPTNVKTTYPSLGMPHFIKEIGDGWNIKSRCGKIFSIGMIHKVGTKKREPFSHDYRAQNMRILIDFLLSHEIPIYAFE